MRVSGFPIYKVFAAAGEAIDRCNLQAAHDCRQHTRNYLSRLVGYVLNSCCPIESLYERTSRTIFNVRLPPPNLQHRLTLVGRLLLPTL